MSSAPRIPGPLTKAIVELINERVTHNGWTYASVASAAGIPESTLHGILKGTPDGKMKPLDMEQLDRLAWTVGYPLEDLVKQAEKNVANRQTSKTWAAERLIAPK